MSEPLIVLEGVAKSFGEGDDRREVLDDVNLAIEEGDIVAIVGFSGSGKTTLVSLLAGLIAPDSGAIRVGGREVRGPDLDRGVVFQNYSLLPWLTVYGNVALGAKRKLGDAGNEALHAHVERHVAMVGLSDAIDKRPHELSGGMRQRVALARALATNPSVLLLDEPLSALDALTRGKLQRELATICAQTGKTVLFVTNDIDEAILLADRIIPLTPGPRASLGPVFSVRLARPRDPVVLNRDRDFVSLRNAVSNYMVDVGREAHVDGEPQHDDLPDLVPALARYAVKA